VVRVGGFLYGLAADAGRVWVLSRNGDPGSQRDWTVRLRRLDQRRGQVTATMPLPQLEVGAFRSPLGLAPGGGAVWVAGPPSGGLHGGGILLRVDPASGRLAGWLRDPLGFFPGVLAAGPRGVWVGTEAPVLLHLVAA
jgi:hypothetical protein